jgi:hypothetical protein
MQMDTFVEAVLPLAVKALDQLIMEISVKADNLPGWRPQSFRPGHRPTRDRSTPPSVAAYGFSPAYDAKENAAAAIPR